MSAYFVRACGFQLDAPRCTPECRHDSVMDAALAHATWCEPRAVFARDGSAGPWAIVAPPFGPVTVEARPHGIRIG